MPKEEKVSLEKAAEAFILLVDSGNYNNRRYHRVLGLLRDAVKSKSGSNFGPIEPKDERPELDADQEQAVEFNLWAAGRIDDLVHPGGRLQKADEAIDTIIQQAEEGTLVTDGARQIAADAKAAAKESGKKTAAEEEAADAVPTKAAVKSKTAAKSSEPAKAASTSTPGGVPAASKKSGS